MAQDYYATLGVEKNATADEIKKAFRRKARELHPDVNDATDAEERFKELNEAYDVLSDTNKKAQYDQFGSVGNGGGYPGGGAGGYQYVDFSDIFGGMGGMGDVFSSFFGGSAGRRSTVRREGRDMNVMINVTIQEVATGVEREIVYDRLAPCDVCGGSGAAEGGESVTCPDCHGTGHVTTVQRTFLGAMQTQSMCPNCQGTGHVIDKPCEECEGQGRVPDREHVTVKVPKGIRNGQQLRVAGFGEAGMHGAASGDLLVTVQVEEDDTFAREGDTLHTRIEVPMVQAALGAELEIPGILGPVTVKIPEGCQDGQKIRVRDEGLPRLNSDARGDLIVHVDVIVPKNLTKRQRELLTELANEMGNPVSSHKGWFRRFLQTISRGARWRTAVSS